MINAGWWAVMAVVVVSGAAAAAPDSEAVRPRVPLPIEGVVTNPDWIEKPSGDQVADAYPPLARAIGLSGKTGLRCTVSASQTLENCRVLIEVPTGLGFGAAALSLTPSFRMKPASIDGAPVGGAEVNIPIRFTQPESPASPMSSEAATAAPESGRSPAALALARKLSDAMHWRTAMDRWVDRTRDQLRALETTGARTPEELAAIDALIQAAIDENDRQLRSREARLTDNLSDDQLKEMVAFFTSPTGQAWTVQSAAILEEEQTLAAGRGAHIVALARQRLCAKITCLQPDPVK
jgi:TonB family protein